MHRLEEHHHARAPLIVLALVIALGAATCIRVHRALARPGAPPAGATVAQAPATPSGARR